LSPAMARLFLKPKAHEGGEAKFIIFRWFNRALKWIENSYDSFLDWAARDWWVIVAFGVGLLVLLGYMLMERPKGFIPNEDQGYLIVAMQTPDGTTREPTSRIVQRIGVIAKRLDGVSDVLILDGLNLITSTNQTNAATVFVILDEWSKRKDPALHAGEITRQLQARVLQEIRGARAIVFQPPPIRGLSQTGGFEFQLEDRIGKGVKGLATVTDRFLSVASERPELFGVFSPFSARVPQLHFDLDRIKARRLGVAVSDVFDVLQTYLGATYVNDFNLYGKTWKVMVQAQGNWRTRADDVLKLYVLNREGNKVPLGALGNVKNIVDPIDVQHYNMYNSAKITGQPAPGYSSGQAIQAMEEVAAEVLPEGFSYEWTGTTYQELKTGSQASYIFALSIICVFLFMAALYESWVLPVVIIVSVPLATFGAMVGLWIYDMPLDVFGQIGLVMLIGLETKNAILIIEFAENLRNRGAGILEAAKESSRQRLRPILMTAFAFIIGVLPMARATGAGAGSRNSLGIVIVFGMLISTILGRFVIPVYYVLGERFRSRGQSLGESAHVVAGARG
jgi:hydrophobe/amphiphile efflux-1 (HAE1) family protein